MKKQRKIEKDNRGVAIYARKSRITNKGDSIGIVFILFFKRHNHSDIIALKIRKSNVEIGARRKSGCIVNG